MRQRKLMNQINVVPYIDVMLVLLVIFMVTAPMLNPTLVELPSVGKSAAQVPETPLEVIVKADATMVLRERTQGKPTDRNVDLQGLVEAIRLKQAQSPDQAVVISADKAVRYEAVLKVMDELQRHGVARVGLMVKAADG